jgi:hypothetical protein
MSMHGYSKLNLSCRIRKIMPKLISEKVGMDRFYVRVSVQLLAALIVAVLFCWFVSVATLPTILDMHWDPVLGENTPVPGSIKRHTLEGWATTIFGQHGLPGGPEKFEPSDYNVAIWGDSFVESFQVSDKDKICHLLARMSRPKFLINFLPVARSGWNLNDVIGRLDAYTKKMGLDFHVIVINGIRDFNNLDLSWDLKTQTPSEHWYRQLVYNFRLNFVRPFYKTIRSASEIDLMPGPRKVRQPNTLEVSQLSQSRVLAVVNRLRHLTQGRLLLVYHDAKIDGSENIGDSLGRACAMADVPFVNLKSHYKSPDPKLYFRGFWNSKPGAGHWNPIGHGLVARIIYAKLNELNVI